MGVSFSLIVAVCISTGFYSCALRKEKARFEAWKTVNLSNEWSFQVPAEGDVRVEADQDGIVTKAFFKDSSDIRVQIFTTDEQNHFSSDTLIDRAKRECNSICQGSSLTSTSTSYSYRDSIDPLFGAVIETNELGEAPIFQAILRRPKGSHSIFVVFGGGPRTTRHFVDSVLSQIRYRM